MSALFSALLMALALAGCAYALVAAALTARMLAPDPAPTPCPDPVPGVSLLKPLYGDEPGLARNLRSFCLQAYPGPVEVLFGVVDPDDPAAAIARALIAEFPERDLRLVVDDRRWGTNGKVSNLINLANRARYPVIVLADSDMRVAPDYLVRVTDALGRPGVGAVTCLYRGLAVAGGEGLGPRPATRFAEAFAGVWSRLAVQWIDNHFLPSVAVGTALGLAKPCFGSTIALRRETLDRIGGFLAVKDRLADDYALGEAIRGLGLAVAVPRGLVLGHTCATLSFRGLLRQELRWARTIRSLDPVGFAGSLVTHPIPLATIAAIASGVSNSAMAVLGLAVASRLLLAVFVARALGSGTKGLILGPVRDYAAFLVFLMSFWPGSIDWRGHRFGLAADGSMTGSDIAGS